MRILVIEDDPTVGQYVKRGLEEHRWAVDLVADGEEGERRASSEAYDLVILDMRLPTKSGTEVLHSLRAKGFERPVLVLTAQDAVDAKVATLRAGADDYVTKPFAFEELLARVEALSRRPRALASPVLRVGDLEHGPSQCLWPPSKGFDACQELFEREGLRDVVVRAGA